MLDTAFDLNPSQGLLCHNACILTCSAHRSGPFKCTSPLYHLKNTPWAELFLSSKSADSRRGSWQNYDTLATLVTYSHFFGSFWMLFVTVVHAHSLLPVVPVWASWRTQNLEPSAGVMKWICLNIFIFFIVPGQNLAFFKFTCRLFWLYVHSTYVESFIGHFRGVDYVTQEDRSNGIQCFLLL